MRAFVLGLVSFRARFLVLALAVLGALGPSSASAQENADCMRCHVDEELYVERGDADEIPGWLEYARFEGSVHGRLECVACHLDLMDEDLPHEDELEFVDCAECHEEVAETHAEGAHGRAAEAGNDNAPTCASCHGTHYIAGRKDPASPTYSANVPLLCIRCHQDGAPPRPTIGLTAEAAAQRFTDRLHGASFLERGITASASCATCHVAHEASSPPRAGERALCGGCHARLPEIHAQILEAEFWTAEEPRLVCSDCHAPHVLAGASPTEGASTARCIACHTKPELGAQRPELVLDLDGFHGGKHSGLSCAQCHSSVDSTHERPCDNVDRDVNCGVCHSDVAERLAVSAHGGAGDDVPTCLSCHAAHSERGPGETSSRSFPLNVSALCAECHRVEGAEGDGPTIDPISSYEHSVHGRGARESGLVVSASCVSCHTAHSVLPAWDPKSSMNGDNVAATCGACHAGIQEIYERSIHFRGRRGVSRLLPSCKDCHASHALQRVGESGFRDAMKRQCGQCHAKEFGTYFETFHGKVSRLGFEAAATCWDCHGTHEVLSVTDPESHMSEGKIVARCGTCHKGSNSGFVQYQPHGDHNDRENYPLLFYAFWGMTSLLVGTMAFFGLHSAFWLVRLWTVRHEWLPHKTAPTTGRVYRRFSPLQSKLHFAMVISFLTLACTGMSLKFSYAPWAQAIAAFLGGFQVTGVLHRIAGLLLFGVFFVHLWDVNRRRKEDGRTWVGVVLGADSMVPNLRDLREFWGTVKWFVGQGERPRYGRWSYWEKFDYFAVFWGVFIIGSTGILLWFPAPLTNVLPGWLVNVATIVHGDEALLAAAFIFTIHFFNTQFRPDKFPLDPVVFTGRMSLEELKYDKPDEYEELVRSGRLEEHMVEPLRKSTDRAIRVFAACALIFGTVLIILILAALLFVEPV